MIGHLRQSLFGQMVLAQFSVLIVTAVSLTFLLSFLLHLTLDDFIVQRLHQDAVSAANPKPDEQPLAARGLYDVQRGSRAFAIVDAQGQTIAKSPRPLTLPMSAFPRRASEVAIHRGPIDAVVMPARWAGKSVWIIVAQDRRHPQVMVDDVVTVFLSRFIWVIPAGLLLSLLANIAITASATRSVAKVAMQVNRVDPQNLNLRIDADSLPLEVRPLAQATNDALDRVARGYEHQGKFIADVAHELRTPLALISLRAENIEDNVVRGKVNDAVGRASRVVTQLMSLARAENGIQSVSLVDLTALTADAVATYAPLVFRSGREISFVSPRALPAQVMASEPLIDIVLANLIENAVRHTPAGTKIILGVEQDGSILVSDDGPGIAMDAQDPFNPRYRRGDSARTDSAGLGLKIIERIMAAHGGKLVIEAKPSRGTRIRLTFPAAHVSAGSENSPIDA